MRYFAAATASSLVWRLALLVAATSLAQDGARRIYMAAAYDDSPAIEVLEWRLQKAVVISGEPVAYWMRYNKRTDCHPPFGSGSVRHVLIDYNAERLPNGVAWRTHLPNERDTRAPAGRNMSLPDFSVVELGWLQPGNYALQWDATYRCAGGSADQRQLGPLMPFVVVEGDTD